MVRFDAGPGERVSLVTRWAVFGPDGNELVPTRGSSVVVSMGRARYEGVAAPTSKAVGELSLDIAAALKTTG
ncbi:MAG: membrane integrity-associated transporter subunit PqiC [Phycisphaerales bacterium]|nr:MAG: membrane integrity-associated transporter subunit PqiC [Phycisphaerales bacterium]